MYIQLEHYAHPTVDYTTSQDTRITISESRDRERDRN